RQIIRFPAEESSLFLIKKWCFHRLAASWLGDLSVVVPGQWRRIIGSSENAATPNFKKSLKRTNNNQKWHFRMFYTLKNGALRAKESESRQIWQNIIVEGR
ncbi:hypothetical protein, partial [Serratia aquatilis]